MKNVIKLVFFVLAIQQSFGQGQPQAIDTSASPKFRTIKISNSIPTPNLTIGALTLFGKNNDLHYVNGIGTDINLNFQSQIDDKFPYTGGVITGTTTVPRLKISNFGDIGSGTDLVQGGNSNDLTFHSTGKIIYSTQGFQRMTITNAGNVGLGTTAPADRFEVNNGNARFVQNVYLASYSDTYKVGVGTLVPIAKLDVVGSIHSSNGTGNRTRINTDGSIDFTNNAQEVYANGKIQANTLSLFGNNDTGIVISPDGSVNINQPLYTEGDNLSVKTRLDSKVNGNNEYNGDYGILISKKIYGTPAPPLFLPNISWQNGFINADDSDLQIALGINTKQEILGGTGFVKGNGDGTVSYDTTIFNISDSVGIGTNNPLYKLHVVGNTGVTGDLAVSGDILFNGNVTGLQELLNSKQDALTNPITGSGTSGYLAKYTGSTTNGNSLIYDNGTNVGIGTSSPLAKLEVGSSYAQTGAFISARNLGNSFEFGHPNQAGYSSTLGANSVNGYSFLAFNTEAGTTSNTYRTRGFTGRLIINDVDNTKLLFQRVVTTNADNQTPVTDMTINNSGNVGIGTISPSAILHTQTTGTGDKVGLVVGRNVASVNDKLSIVYNSADLGDQASIVSIPTSGTAGDLAFTTRVGSALSEKMRILSNGNIGIGTTTPSSKLQVDGGHENTNLKLHSFGGGTSATEADLNLWASEPSYTYTGTGISNNITNGASGFTRNSTARGGSYMRLLDDAMRFNVVDNAGTDISAMIISTGGKVGIGTVTPDKKLVVNGQIGFSYSDGNSYTGLSASTDLLALQFFTNVTGALSNNNYRFSNNAGTDIFVIQNGGAVGVNTNNPTATLDVNGYAKLKPMTTAEINAIASPSNGMIAFNSDLGMLVCYSTSWKRVHDNSAM